MSLEKLQESKIPFLIINLCSSFTSLFISLFIVKELAQLSGKENLIQALGLAAYLGGLGAGSLLLKSHSQSYRLISWCEIGNAFVGLFSIPFLFCYLGLSTSLSITAAISPQDISLLPLLVCGGFSTFLLGLFTGAELPEFLKFLPSEKGKVLFLNYFGSLLSGIFLNFLLSRAFQTNQILVIFAILSSLTLLMISIDERSLLRLGSVLAPSLFLFGSLFLFEKSESNFLAAYYQGIKVQGVKEAWNLNEVSEKMGKVEVFKSPFQEIHVVTDYPPKQSEDKGNITLYLNYRPQFDLNSFETYHQTMLFGALNLSRTSPQNILILGGGDGILLAKVKKNLPHAKVTLVELDPMMISLFTDRPNLSHYNNHVFDGQNNVIVEDGFYFLKNSDELFDGIFIDFPYPYSDELTGLYSREFYGVLKKRLSPKGFAIVDFPVTEGQGTSLLYENLKTTLNGSGFHNIFPFGPYSSFVYFENLGTERRDNIDFNYEQLPETLHLSTALNLVGLSHLKSKPGLKGKVFSLFYEY